MKTSKRFLASSVLIALVCLSTVQGQHVTNDAYSSSVSTLISASSAISRAPEYLSGTVQSIRDENSMYVDFTGSNIPEMKEGTLILLPRPVPMRDLLYFQGKELTFILLGHDILGRPVCDAYLDRIPIEYYLPEFKYYPSMYAYYYPDRNYCGAKSLCNGVCQRQDNEQTMWMAEAYNFLYRTTCW